MLSIPSYPLSHCVCVYSVCLLSFLLNHLSYIMFVPFIHSLCALSLVYHVDRIGALRFFVSKIFKSTHTQTIQWHCRMNFTPYLTISFLSILSAQICINELDMTMYFVGTLFFSSFFRCLLLCLRTYLPPHYVSLKCSSNSQENQRRKK